MEEEIIVLNAHVELLNFFANISDEDDDASRQNNDASNLGLNN